MAVLKRLRTESKLEVFQTAFTLSIQLGKFLYSDKKVPKKYRHTYVNKIIDSSLEMLDCIVLANSIKPKTIESKTQRLLYQTRAYEYCVCIENTLAIIFELCPQLNGGVLKDIVDLILTERKLLSGWRKQTKKTEIE